jgi:hypothetical protein
VQSYTARTKQLKRLLPQAVHLKQNEANLMIIDGLNIEIWPMKSVREMYIAQECRPAPLHALIQNATHRSEQWTSSRFNMTPEQLSNNTFRVIDRFTAETVTA